MPAFSTEQNLPFTVKVVDGRGRVAPFDGIPVAASSDETVGTVALTGPNADGSWSGLVTSVSASPEGTTQRVTVTGDADLGAGVVEVVGFMEYNVTADPRSAERIVQVEAQAPIDKP